MTMRLNIFDDVELIEQLVPMPTPAAAAQRTPTVVPQPGRHRDVGYDVSDAIDDICMVLHDRSRHRWDAA